MTGRQPRLEDVYYIPALDICGSYDYIFLLAGDKGSYIGGIGRYLRGEESCQGVIAT